MNYSIFDLKFEPIAVLNKKLEVVYANQSFANLSGVSIRKANSSKLITEIITFDDDLLGGKIGLDEFKDFGFYKEVNVMSSDLKKTSVQFMLQVMPDTNDEEFILFIRDVSLEKSLHGKYRNEIDKKEEVISKLKSAQAELRDYSQNLEDKVQERTKELRESYELQTAMLDSVSQGFFIINRDKKVMPQYSKICESWFGDELAGKSFSEVLMITDDALTLEVDLWIDAVFRDMIPFEDAVGLSPARDLQIKDYEMHFEYFCLFDGEKGIKGIVVVASDRTEQIRIEKELDREKSFAQMLTRVLEHRSQFQSFIRESKDFFAQVQTQADFITKDDAETFSRHLHTLKGGAATFRLFDLEAETHSVEEDISELNCQALDNFQVKGLVRKVKILENVLDETVNTVRLWLQMPDLDEERKLVLSMGDLTKWYHDLMEYDETQAFARMIRDEYLFERVEDSLSYLKSEADRVARKSGKLLRPISFVGGDVRVFPEHYSGLFGALVHAIRNCIDHGLEVPEERKGLGKDEYGQIVITADRFSKDDQNWLQIEIQDDGQGIDVDVLRSKLSEELQTQKCDEEVIDMIFSDGISTAESLTDLSGRGIGMAAIRAEARSLGGEAWIESEFGQGTKLFVKVPLSMDIAKPGEVAKSA